MMMIVMVMSTPFAFDVLWEEEQNRLFPMGVKTAAAAEGGGGEGRESVYLLPSLSYPLKVVGGFSRHIVVPLYVKGLNKEPTCPIINKAVEPQSGWYEK